MADIIKGEGLDRTDIDTPLREISFASAAARQLSRDIPVVRVLPDVNVIKVGGQSIMDRGRSAVHPLVEEIARVKADHKLLTCVGGGTRARHAYSVALDLQMPTSILAKVGLNVPVQNARMLQLLLAPHGGILIDHEAFGQLPLYYAMGCLPILPGMPPYGYWEKPARTGRIPTNRTDSGTYLTAEVMGARSCIFVKDEEGLFTANPKVDKHAKHIPRIHAQELLDAGLPDLVVEPVVLENLLRAETVKQVQIINGLIPGNLTRALNGEEIGTIIYAD
ncbi:MAG: uridine kinase [Alphaproteobacteria bacterium]|nr:uridine kinase [Alphaproteobacteria bacterium]